MGLLLWIIFGAIAGWLASLFTGRDARQGAIGNILVGIVGAVVGGWLAGMLGFSGVTGFNVGSLVVATLGAVLVLSIFNAVGARR